MAQKKDFKFNPELVEMARFHFALSHPARLQILDILKQNGASNFDQLTRDIPLHRATISQHLTILKRVQLITPRELQSGAVGYCLNDFVYTHLQQALANHWEFTA